MRKITSALLCFCFLFVLLAGCSSSPGSTSTNGSSGSSSSSASGQGGVDGSWREAYYQVAMDNLRLDGGYEAVEVTLYYLESQLPAMTIMYSTEDRYDALVKLWRVENDIPQFIYETSEERYVCINSKTGNPVYRKSTGQNSLYVEWDGKQEIPLYEMRERNDDGYDYYLYEDDKLIEWPQSYGFSPNEYLNLTIGHKFIPLRGMAEKVLEAQLLQEYYPTVPDEAPVWVAQYVKLIYETQFFKYDKDEQVDLGPDGLNILNLTLIDIPEYMDNPILYAYGISGSYEKSYFYINTNSYGELEVEDIISIIGAGFGSLLHKDKNGKPALLFFDEYGLKSWSHVTENGFEPIVSSTLGYDFPAYIACDGQVKYCETWEEADAWRDAKTDEALARHGYGPQAEMTELTGPTYTLPLRRASWAQLEPILVDIFCEHAKTIGQWGT